MLNWLVKRLTGKNIILVEDNEFAIVCHDEGMPTIYMPAASEEFGGDKVVVPPLTTYFMACLFRMSDSDHMMDTIAWFEEFHEQQTGVAALRVPHHRVH